MSFAVSWMSSFCFVAVMMKFVSMRMRTVFAFLVLGSWFLVRASPELAEFVMVVVGIWCINILWSMEIVLKCKVG